MRKEDFVEFLHKNIRITTKNGYNYQGKLLSITQTHLKMDDRKIKNLKLPFEDINSVGEIPGVVHA